MPPLQEELRQTQAHAVLPGAVDAGPHTALPRVLHFLFLPGEPRQRAFPACDAMVTSFRFPGRPGKERSQRKGAAGQAKNKRAAHTVRPAPTPGPLTLALTFLIHFNDRIKRITRLRTLFNHLSVPALSLVTGQFHLWRATSPAHNGKNPRMTSRREADTTAPPAYCRQRSM